MSSSHRIVSCSSPLFHLPLFEELGQQKVGLHNWLLQISHLNPVLSVLWGWPPNAVNFLADWGWSVWDHGNDTPLLLGCNSRTALGEGSSLGTDSSCFFTSSSGIQKVGYGWALLCEIPVQFFWCLDVSTHIHQFISSTFHGSSNSIREIFREMWHHQIQKGMELCPEDKSSFHSSTVSLGHHLGSEQFSWLGSLPSIFSGLVQGEPKQLLHCDGGWQSL